MEQQEKFPFTKGLHKINDHVYAWLTGPGGGGFANSGLVVGDGESLVIDTQYDLGHAQEFIDAIAPIVADAPVKYVVNTHSDGDHIYGNQLFGSEVEIISSAAAAGNMPQRTANMMVELTTAGENADSIFRVVKESYGSEFDFRGIKVRRPDRTFSGSLSLNVGGLDVELLELGPAHTEGDLIVNIPEKSVLVTGDLMAGGGDGYGVPVVWSGPVSNWISALDTINSIGADTFVGGHGPILSGTETKEAYRSVRAYWSDLFTHVKEKFDAQVPVTDAIEDLSINVPKGMLQHNARVIYQDLDRRFAA